MLQAQYQFEWKSVENNFHLVFTEMCPVRGKMVGATNKF